MATVAVRRKSDNQVADIPADLVEKVLVNPDYELVEPPKEAAPIAPPEPSEPPGYVESAVRGAAQGASLGFADEGTAMAEALARKATGDDRDFKEIYKQALEESRANYRAAEEENPVTSFIGNIAGGFALPLGAAKAIKTLPAAAKVLSPIAPLVTKPTSAMEAAKLAAKAGAVSGALYGAGASEGSLIADENANEALGKIVSDAATGGMSGAVIGGALGAGAYGLGKLGGDVAKNLKQTESIEDMLDVRQRALQGVDLLEEGSEQKYAEEIAQHAKDYVNLFNKLQSDVGKVIGESSKQLDEAGVKVNLGTLLDDYERQAVEIAKNKGEPTKEVRSIMKVLRENLGKQPIEKFERDLGKVADQGLKKLEAEVGSEVFHASKIATKDIKAKEKLDDLATELAKLGKEQDDVLKVMEASEAKLAPNRTKAESLITNLDDIKTNAAEIKAAKSEIQARLKELKAQIPTKKKDILPSHQKILQEIEALKQEETMLSSEAFKLSAQKTKLEAQIKKANKTIVQPKEVSEAEKKAAKLAKDLEKIQKQIDNTLSKNEYLSGVAPVYQDFAKNPAKYDYRFPHQEVQSQIGIPVMAQRTGVDAAITPRIQPDPLQLKTPLKKVQVSPEMPQELGVTDARNTRILAELAGGDATKREALAGAGLGWPVSTPENKDFKDLSQRLASEIRAKSKEAIQQFATKTDEEFAQQLDEMVKTGKSMESPEVQELLANFQAKVKPYEALQEANKKYGILKNIKPSKSGGVGANRPMDKQEEEQLLKSLQLLSRRLPEKSGITAVQSRENIEQLAKVDPEFKALYDKMYESARNLELSEKIMGRGQLSSSLKQGGQNSTALLLKAGRAAGFAEKGAKDAMKGMSAWLNDPNNVALKKLINKARTMASPFTDVLERALAAPESKRRALLFTLMQQPSFREFAKDDMEEINLQDLEKSPF